MSEEAVSLEEQIRQHSEGAPEPQVNEATVIKSSESSSESKPEEGEKKTEDKKAERSQFKKHFLGKGFLSGLLLNILITVFSYGNAMVYNLVMKSRKIDDWRKLKPAPDSEEEEEINDLIDLYAPKIMDYLDGLPDEVLMLVFIEYGFINRMHMASIEVKEEEKKEEDKKEESVKEESVDKDAEKKDEVVPVEGNKLIFVITRAEKPQYWKEDNIYTDLVSQAYHFDTGEMAALAKNKNETVTTWKIKK